MKDQEDPKEVLPFIMLLISTLQQPAAEVKDLEKVLSCFVFNVYTIHFENLIKTFFK